MKNIPVALQLYSLRGEWSLTPLQTLKFVKEAGYTGVEFYGNAFSPAFHAALLAETGLVCAGWHTGIDALEGDAFEATLKKNLAVGNHYIAVPWFKAESADGWKQFADRLNAAAAKLAPYGIKLGYHNHAHEFVEMDGIIPWAVIAENTDPEIFLQLDTGNCMSSGTDMLAWLKKYPGRNTTLHCKPWSDAGKFDYTKGDDCPWKEVVNWCRGEGKTQWLIVEYEDTVDPRGCCEKLLKESLNV